MSKDNIVVAFSSYMSGTAFWEAAKQLESYIETDQHGKPIKLMPCMPYYVLIMHAAELFLKAALLKRGFDEKQLSGIKYRHNLLALSDELQKKGVIFSEHTITLLKGLTSQHKEHTLRYMKFVGEEKHIFYPPFKCVNTMLDELFIYTRLNTGNS